jgi:limonene-1,2-epoxide hydrolase
VTTDPIAVARALWSALSRRDWDAVAALLSEDAIYYDVPIGPASAAKGPVGIVARLRLGLGPLAAYENVERAIAATGDVVMVEHEETWHWPTGESAVLPFVTVHRVVDGRVVLWKDYWNYATLIDGAPPGWQESLLAGDLSWVFDATGLA